MIQNLSCFKSQTFSINREANCKRKRSEKIERKRQKFCCKLATKITYYQKIHNCPKSFHSWVLKSKSLELSHLASSVQTNYPNTPHTSYRSCSNSRTSSCNTFVFPNLRKFKAATQVQNTNYSFKVSLLDFKPFISSIIDDSSSKIICNNLCLRS